MSYVLDTGVLLEYIDRQSPYRRAVEDLFEKASKRKIELLVNTITLGELLYTANQIYKAAGQPKPNLDALTYLEWLKTKVEIVVPTEEIAVVAGELKKELRIALPDCFVVATAQKLGAIPLFRHVEAEMRPIEHRLRELGVKFLEDL